jgi:5-formyltetrahydrofolate cyclo-ligase
VSELVQGAKAELRAALRERRRRLVATDVARWSAALCDAILGASFWAGARTVAGFVGVKNEPDTMRLLRAARRQGKRIVLPRVRPGGAPTLDFVEIDDVDTGLVPGSYGLREPSGVLVHRLDALVELDLVLVPGLAFARTGERIGLGPGYYDRALAPIAAEATPLRVGLCFAAFLDPHEGPIPTEPTDVPVHAIATELGVHVVQKSA